MTKCLSLLLTIDIVSNIQAMRRHCDGCLSNIIVRMMFYVKCATFFYRWCVISSFLNFRISFFFVYQFRILIELNQTDRIENVTLEVCNEFDLVLDVCSGAVHEYKVNHLYHVHLNTVSTLTNRMSFFMSLP